MRLDTAGFSRSCAMGDMGNDLRVSAYPHNALSTVFAPQSRGTERIQSSPALLHAPMGGMGDALTQRPFGGEFTAQRESDRLADRTEA